ncbi:acetate/propionate family kinase [Aureliella helgolandensis]|uniref:Acetate kinase n=1 Tax=Aureliella helgolandensis TaxID=2527968 RepID=A0A518GD16_9BACT|nr:acetate/propionate family kinase [Aureliella helgolandensis]QDV26457.1 putative propionate kinase [Aureliella helgolandensis]
MNDHHILTINGGSSSIKFAVFHLKPSLHRGLTGKLDRIGCDGTRLTFSETERAAPQTVEVAAADHLAAAEFLLDWLESQNILSNVAAIGHRIVHGMQRTQPEIVTPEMLDELHRICPYAAEHLPGELSIIAAFRKHIPSVPQVVCFDTAFHRTMPRVATLLPIPRRYEAQGLQRYGFHGLSYAYLIQELRRLGDPAAVSGRVILAHLGNGASMAAVRNGQCIDTSMAFTPSAGLPMGTRTGDLDPGLFHYLTQVEGMTPDQFHRMVNHESGLLGVSETSSDMRDLLAIESSDFRAAEAIQLFCYQAKKWIGAFVAALGGLDTLVFAGGVGENSPGIRASICRELQCLGIELDEERNAENASSISSKVSRVNVKVISTDEEIMIAHSVEEIVRRLDLSL